MNTQLNLYANILSDSVFRKISDAISSDTGCHWAIEKIKFHFNNPRSSKFQEYYFSILSDSQNFLADENFFGKFKQQYGLQGITNEYLSMLEISKSAILKLIEGGRLAELYYNYFSRALVRRGDSYKEINLGSFFTKLVHNFLPGDYCALDNPIKDGFGLKNEGFFLSFIVISDAYKNYSVSNQKGITEIRNQIFEMDKKNLFKKDKLTDIKLLDLIFWSDTNRPL